MSESPTAAALDQSWAQQQGQGEEAEDHRSLQEHHRDQPQDDGSGTNARTRKRTRLACDKCSFSRTRCDGLFPCGRCQDYGYPCHYNRQIKKRGRARRIDKAASESEAARRLTDADRSYGDDVRQSGTPSASPAGDSNGSQGGSVGSGGRMKRGGESQPGLGDGGAMICTPRSGGGGVGISEGATSFHMDSYMMDRHGGGGNTDGYPFENAVDTTFTRPPRPRLLSTSSTVAAAAAAAGAAFPATTPLFGFNLASPNSLDGPTTSGHHHHPQHGARNPRGGDSGCRYRVLDPLLPFLGDTFPVSVACDLLDVFLIDPGTSLFRFSSPYILTRIFRKKSLLHPTHPRPLTPALLATILWCCAQTADISVLLVPGSRSKLTNALYELATTLMAKRDPDRWRRIHGGLRVEHDNGLDFGLDHVLPNTTESNEPVGTIEDVLTFILLSIGVSAGDFKSDSHKWWSKAIRLAHSLRLHREDAQHDDGMRRHESNSRGQSAAELETQEERRRVFWLLYCLDRHLALSYNKGLSIPDHICDVYAPLPERVWEALDEIPYHAMPRRTLGPPTSITGVGFFEYFLPLMVILGDIIELHNAGHHPRLGTFDTSHAENVIASTIAGLEASLDHLARKLSMEEAAAAAAAGNGSHNPDTTMQISSIVTGLREQQPASQPNVRHGSGAEGSSTGSSSKSDIRLVLAYSTFITHVLHVLFHGKWDAISMLDNDDDWITTPRFVECASHAIAASEAVSDILTLDPELTFMPYLFGIYLLHGSFILLLFADRMPQLGPNQSVEQACETIIRAHEVCVVTLSTEFQRNFRRVVRSTLYSVRGGSPTGREEHRLARRQVLSLYRWTRGAKGLGL